MNCYYHPDRPSVARCVVCGKDLCTDCNIIKEGQNYCRDCLGMGEVPVELGKMLLPVLGCGLLGGVLSIIPIVQFGNCLCCLWIILAGGLAVFILKRYYNIKGKISTGNALITGGSTGFVASFITLLPVMLFPDQVYSIVDEALRSPEFQEAFQDAGVSVDASFFVVLAAVILIIAYSLFGALGGIISNEITK